MNYADSEYDHSSKGKVQVWNLQHLRTFSAPNAKSGEKALRRCEAAGVPKMYFSLDLYTNGNKSSDFTG
jgi:hypothetical protein